MPTPAHSCTIVSVGPGAPAHYFQEMAHLHATELQAGLLAKFGVAFLADFYNYVAGDPGCVLLVALEGDKVIGFVSGTHDIGKFYHRFILRRGLKLATRLVPYLLSRRALSSIVSLRRYLTSRNTTHLPVSELTSLAVDVGAQRKGVGKALFAALQEHFRSEGIQAFQVTAAKTQVAALQFYPALGAKLVAKTQLGTLESFVFVCPTPRDPPGST
ncbi:MAG: GNAT family N-acetyltransferase [Bacillati bacterium ANGP1]|uniref:GNAT family N-acetyltransferase n=1 Tax=Candidatus Segetimicrobium genomatis TaxID=2569760 RepID=A0A537KTN3_9BACT|nr:MAG: GNAT family N-acetyltransferase [Terrabacteria group bacterium ANGP1]